MGDVLEAVTLLGTTKYMYARRCSEATARRLLASHAKDEVLEDARVALPRALEPRVTENRLIPLQR